MIANVLSLIFSSIEDFIELLSTWYVFGTISMLHLVILFAITGMIVNVFVGRGKV